MKAIKMMFAGALTLISASAFAGMIYSTDDGSGESSLGCDGCNIIWLNGYQVEAGGERIDSIDIAFGANINLDPPGNGSPISVYLWGDANNDGNPADAFTIGTPIISTIQQSHTDTFINFTLSTPVTFDIGEWFYVGFSSTDYAVSRDTNTTSPNSWLAGWSGSNSNPDDLDSGNVGFGNTASFGFGGNFLIRANASAVAVPAPASIGLFAVALLGLVNLRRK